MYRQGPVVFQPQFLRVVAGFLDAGIRVRKAEVATLCPKHMGIPRVLVDDHPPT